MSAVHGHPHDELMNRGQVTPSAEAGRRFLVVRNRSELLEDFQSFVVLQWLPYIDKALRLLASAKG